MGAGCKFPRHLYISEGEFVRIAVDAGFGAHESKIAFRVWFFHWRTEECGDIRKYGGSFVDAGCSCGMYHVWEGECEGRHYLRRATVRTSTTPMKELIARRLKLRFTERRVLICRAVIREQRKRTYRAPRQSRAA